MATSQLAYAAEKAMGHRDEYTKQDVSNYNAEGLGDPNEKMLALTWQGKNSVAVCSSLPSLLPSLPACMHMYLTTTSVTQQQPKSPSPRSSRMPTSSSR